MLALSDNRVLVILVINEREVQNRIIHTDRNYSQQELDMVLHYRDQFRNSGEPNTGRGLNLD